jgi:hypothetical protein
MLVGTFNSDALRYSLFAWGFVNLWAAFHYWRAGYYLADDLARVGSK